MLCCRFCGLKVFIQRCLVKLVVHLLPLPSVAWSVHSRAAYYDRRYNCDTEKNLYSLVWLTLLVVIAEFLIVVARFIYGYEQTFMGDLVRFLVRSTIFLPLLTLKEDAHVRVDVFYAFLRRPH